VHKHAYGNVVIHCIILLFYAVWVVDSFWWRCVHKHKHWLCLLEWYLTDFLAIQMLGLCKWKSWWTDVHSAYILTDLS